MSSALSTLNPELKADGLPQSVWRAPLVPAALAVTAGIVLDRYFAIPLVVSLTAAAAFAAAYHHYRRSVYPREDIGNFTPDEPRVARLRGRLDSEPKYTPEPPPDPLLGQRQTVGIVQFSIMPAAGRVPALAGLSSSLHGSHFFPRIRGVTDVGSPH
jgi:hypothetical protein